jgi:hypothetical protein
MIALALAAIAFSGLAEHGTRARKAMGVRKKSFTLITLVAKFLLEKSKPLVPGHFAKSLWKGNARELSFFSITRKLASKRIGWIV